jgi:hypothetical protein
MGERKKIKVRETKDLIIFALGVYLYIFK